MSEPVRVSEVMHAGEWTPGSADDRITLDFDERHRRRMRYVATGGTVFLLDVPRAIVLQSGDGLRLEDGRIIAVAAAAEKLVQITAAAPQLLMRLAWHIGNRHLPAQLEATRIVIREDPVIVAMLKGLGATVESILEPFTPESGAYDTPAGSAAPVHAHDAHDKHHHHDGHRHD